MVKKYALGNVDTVTTLGIQQRLGIYAQDQDKESNMASVRLSEDLRNRIHRNAMEAFDVANPQWKPTTDFQTKIKEAIRTSGFQELAKEIETKVNVNGLKLEKDHYGLANIIPEKIDVTSIELIKPKSQEDVDNGLVSYARDSVSLEMDFETPVNLYARKGHYGHFSNVVDVRTFEQEHTMWVTEDMVKALLAKKAWREKRDNYFSKLRSLLDNCNTLKQLLETWPAAESLVPSEKIQQMHTKVSRNQAAKQRREAIEFDADEANQTVLTAKLMGG